MISLILLTVVVSQTLTHRQTDIKTIRKLSAALSLDLVQAGALSEARLLVAEGHRPGAAEFVLEGRYQVPPHRLGVIGQKPAANPRVLILRMN